MAEVGILLRMEPDENLVRDLRISALSPVAGISLKIDSSKFTKTQR